jgi:hypothetical protein
LTIPQTRVAPLLELYRHLLAHIDDGSIDGDLPLVVTFDDDTFDFGMLTNLVVALSWRRDESAGAIERDSELLRAALLGDEPMPLFGGGIFLAP